MERSAKICYSTCSIRKLLTSSLHEKSIIQILYWHSLKCESMLFEGTFWRERYNKIADISKKISKEINKISLQCGRSDIYVSFEMHGNEMGSLLLWRITNWHFIAHLSQTILRSEFIESISFDICR